VIFQRLQIRNFLSISEAELTFPQGVHLIHGVNYDMSSNGQESNGSGKSSLMDAILWVLFGVLNRGKVKEDDVINRKAGSNCCVEVEFTHAGNTFKIRRYRKSDEEKGSGVRWWVNGAEQTSHGSKDTQNDLAARLPVSLSVFRTAVMVGQGMPDRFLDLSETDKQVLLGEIVDLTDYDRAVDRAKDQLSSLTTQVAVSRGSLESVKGQIARVRCDLDLNERALVSYKGQIATDQDALAAELKRLDDEMTRGKAAKERLEASLPAMTDKLAEVSACLPKLQEDRDLAVRKTADSRAKVNSFQREQDRIASAPEVCPTCKRPMDGREGVCDALMEIAVKQAAEERILKALMTDETNIVAAFQTKSGDVFKVRALITEAEAKLRTVNSALLAFSQKRAEAERRQSHYTSLVAQYQSKVDAIKDNIKKLEESLIPQEAHLKDLDTTYKHWEFWRTAIPNLRAAAMEEVLGYLNDRLSFYMDIFSGGAMGVRLYQEAYGKGSKIRVELKTPAGTYDLSSGGEKRRVDLAIYLSLSDLLQTTSGMACNLLAADEICDSLSPTGVRQFLDVLKVLAEAGRCVFVMSHNSAVAQQFEFDSVKIVERRDGKATVCAA
jgi:DNA repair exonuclease SbcCD ATPase subunit